MRPTKPAIRAGMSLLEVLAGAVLLGVIAAAVAPAVNGAAAASAESSRTRLIAESASFALDRVARMVRQAPQGATPGSVGITELTVGVLRFDDGAGVRLEGDDLILETPSEPDAVLCSGVVSFVPVAFAEDGLTIIWTDFGATHRVMLRLVCDGFELRTLVFPRARISG